MNMETFLELTTLAKEILSSSVTFVESSNSGLKFHVSSKGWPSSIGYEDVNILEDNGFSFDGSSDDWILTI